MVKRFILYAPNVHTGGGVVLLQSILLSWPISQKIRAFLDIRAKNEIMLPDNIDVSWVRPSIISRLNAEVDLFRIAKKKDLVFCFHGLPPLFPIVSEVLLFQQNRIHLGLDPLSQFSYKVRLRLLGERTISKVFKKRVTQYIVQTPSMKKALIEWYSDIKTPPKVDVFPFFDTLSLPSNHSRSSLTNVWDFIYVADGVAHKNHLRLLDAWVMLAKEGLFPSLAVTLTSRDELLIERFKAITAKFSLNIVNLGQLNRDEIGELYSMTEALVFPSTSESFGLPLIEASQANVKIVASELDFVRDVCSPVETFDPSSVISIYRSVKRYLRSENKPLKIHSAKEFIDEYVIK